MICDRCKGLIIDSAFTLKVTNEFMQSESFVLCEDCFDDLIMFFNYDTEGEEDYDDDDEDNFDA